METCASIGCSAAVSPLPGNLFSQLINVLLVSQTALNRSADYPADRTAEALTKKDFDFVIVGSGTAGSVVARRLAEVDDWDVLLIEAGTDASPTSEVPGLYQDLQNTAEDYAYKTEPQPGYCENVTNNDCRLPKGKALGGSSVINAMMHAFGNDRDYNQWEEQGNEGWGYENMLRYLRKATNCPPEYIAEFGDRHCGKNGPMALRSLNFSYSHLHEILLNATREMGLAVLQPLVSDRYIGHGKALATIENGQRVNIAKAFLSPIKNKKNLYVMKSTRADKVLLEGNKAVGVRVTSESRTIDLTASKEVILSAGSIASPQLLMLSGIGPKEHLRDMGIQVVADLPVGENYQNHIFWNTVAIQYVNKTTDSPTAMDVAYNYLMRKTGLLTFNGVSGTAFVNPNDLGQSTEKPYSGSSKYPELQINTFPYARLAKTDNVELDNVIIMINSILLQPKSRGFLKLRSTDPADPPEIHGNFFTEREDFETLMKAVDFIKALAQTPTVKKYNMTLRYLDIPGCKDQVPGSTEYWECNIRTTAIGGYHNIGTAKMGTKDDPTAVVDSRLRVHGVQSLRVIDASIMPKCVSGNVNSPIMAIAEKGADMVKEDWMH